MSARRIVVVLLEPPAPLGNAAARWYYVLLRELVARGHHVTCFAACSKASDMTEARRLFPSPGYDLRLYPFPPRSGLRAKLATLRRPFSYMFSPELVRDLEAELARGYDVLHLEQLWTGWLGLGHVARALVNVHYLPSIDLADTRPSDAKGRRDSWLMGRAERTLLRRFSRFHACSTRLAEGIVLANPRAEVVVVPLGLDATLYPFVPEERRPSAPVVSLIGSMGWAPTRSAAVRLLTRLWPEIRRRVPQARLELVGWGARAALSAYAGTPGASIEEDVPDTRPYFERASALLYAPVRGSGMKIKILEAMAYGVPVVTTAEGVEGLPAVDGTHAGIADDDAGLVERTVALLTDPARGDRQRAAGRALLEAHCGPKPTVDGIERIHAAMTEGGPA